MSVAIVTGASRGLGEALATGLAGAGWSLVVDGRDPDTLDAAAARIRAGATAGARIVALAGDITDEDHRHDLTAAAFELGGLDLVVNNAGTLGTSPLPSLADYPLDDLRIAFEVNVVAPLAVVQDALPLLLDAPHPRLLNVTSDAAVEAYEGWGGYGAGKAALEHLGAVLAAEFPALTVWSVDPGDLRTAMHQAAFPGEDISDRPEPSTAVPAFLELIGSARPSGRYRAAELLAAGAVAGAR
jgi:NAD(P)-dependent dehydrogenase (short-subunit alcohol dehydrogenase family)